MNAPKKKTVVLGLDGATWKLLNPLIERGYMPTLAVLVAAGTHSVLKSTYPAMTAPSWTTFVTGKNPGHHGVFDFMIPTDSLSRMKFATGSDIKDVTLYERLDKAGYTPILINLPGSYPPRLKNAITITSLLTQGDEWIFPKSLKDEFPGFSKYRLTPDESLRLKERKESYIEDLLKHLDEQMECVKWLFNNKPWDFFFYLFSHTDWISHLAYTELIEDFDESSIRVFQKVDEHLKWFVDNLPKGTNLILLSDHGFASYKKIFYFNKWLEQEGYLTTNILGDAMKGAATRRAKETARIQGQRKKITIGKPVFDFFARFPLLEKTAKWSYHHIVKRYLPIHVSVSVGIDFEHTRVCFPKGSYITNAYINKKWVYTDGVVTKEEYPGLIQELMTKIKAIRDPEGNPIVKDVYTREQIYGENVPDQAPDLFFELSDYWFVGQFHSGQLFAREVHNKHDADGMFLCVGPEFQRDALLPALDMQDMTPLILHLNGLDVPKECDGKVPFDVFAPGAESARRVVRHSVHTAPSEKERIQSVIASLRSKK